MCVCYGIPKHSTFHALKQVIALSDLCNLTDIKCDSKRWTQLKIKPHLNTHQTVGYGISSSLLALRVDLRGLRSKLSWIRLTFSSDTRGRPELLPLHRQPICSNWRFQRQMLFLVGGWMLKRRRDARCTAVADSVLMNSMQKILCCIVAILFSTETVARLCIRWALQCWYLNTQNYLFQMLCSSFICHV